MAQYYEIRIKGHLDKSWQDWLNGLVINHETSGETLLVGSLPDQAALHGVLNQLRDLSVDLISVNPIEKCQATDEENHDNDVS